MVLVGWAAFHLGKQTAGIRGTPASVPLMADMGLSPDDVAQKVRAFGAVDQSFDGQAGWLLLSANNTDVGLNQSAGSQRPTTRGAGTKVLLVRLNLVRGTDVVSEADVLIVAGTTANVVVPTKLGIPLQYHIVTSARDPMRLRVQVQVPRQGVVERVANMPASGPNMAELGTSLDLQPYRDATAGRLVLDRESFDLQVAAATSNLPE